jgi:hypothetical protein
MSGWGLCRHVVATYSDVTLDDAVDIMRIVIV